MKALPITRERIWPWPRVGVAALALTFLSSLASASEYCTKEQHQHDHALIENAFSIGMLAKGPKGLRDSILVQEGEWYKMEYPQQIAFMQSFECSVGGGKKQFLYMDVRSLATGKLLATWTLGVLKPAEEPRAPSNPGMPEVNEDENRFTGEARVAFIKSATEECNKRYSGAPINCSCYANALADSLSIKELKETAAPRNREAGLMALRPKLEAAAKRCLTN